VSEPLVLSEPGVVWRVTMNRPSVRNAISPAMRVALMRALGEAAADPACRVVVLRGAGADFCAGADLADLAAAVEGEGEGGVDYVRSFDALLEAVENQPQPVIAAVRGEALGAGCLLVLACDLAIAADVARLGIPATRLGLVVSYEMIERLVAAAGPKRSADLLESGHEISGATAAEWGLVNRAVPAGEVDDAADALARRVAARAPLAVKASKRGIRAVAEQRALDRFTDGHRVADFDMMAAETMGSEDLKEGLAALRERRRPDFKGR
jgi:enoyl-CoA hydratase/carnithine racemase